MQRVIDLNHPDYTKKATVYLNPEKPVRAAREFVSFLREHAAELTQM